MLDKIADGAALRDGNSDHLIVFFSSVNAMNKNTFDCEDFSKDMPQFRLYVRDEGQRFSYFNGLPGLTNNMDENIEFLKYFVDRVNPSRVTFGGLSMGSFGALAMGHAVGVDDIHAVSPVNYLNRDIGGTPDQSELWPGAFDPVNTLFAERGDLDKKYLDVRSFMDENPGKVRLVRQYVCAKEAIDMNHAAHIDGYDHVQTFYVPRGRHSTVGAIVLRNGLLMHGMTSPIETLQQETPDPAPNMHAMAS